ncbi:MAG TPA: sigma-70 family RNA polymerase sigma factor [Clostridia bacterium]|nr:sigma-70 family RNA polymerase sigma factor [Clostridia bacterium]
MLSQEQTLELLKQAQSGDDAAKTALLEHNMPLIKSIARRYMNKQIEYDDLMQLGRLGFIKAVNNFDLNYGVRFSTYAVPMIAGEIKRYIRDNGAIKVSRSIKAQNMLLNNFVEVYRSNNGKEPTLQEMADYLKVDTTELVFIMDSSKYPVSLYAENDEEGLCLVDRISAKGTHDEYIEKIVLRQIIESFDERDKKIIYLRYFRDETQSEIAKKLGVSQVQISRLESKILERIRKELV